MTLRNAPDNLLRPILFGLLMLGLAACSDNEVSWNSKNITGVMPDLAFELDTAQGKAVTASDFNGQVRLLFFGYTSCPDVCPATLAYLHQVIQLMPADLRTEVTPLFVSVDPDRDTPERLAQYVDYFDNRIVGLRGPEDDLRELTKRYRTTFGYGEPDARGNYAVSHSSAIYVFDQQGRIRLLLKSDMPREQAAEDLTRLARQSAS